MKRDLHLWVYLGSVAFTLVTSGPVAADPIGPIEPRSIDGSGNNLAHPDWGSVGSPLLRLTTVDYADRVAEPAAPYRPSARLISNLVCAQERLIANPVNATDFLWQWGQFIDHDTTLVDPTEPLVPFDIEVPTGDPFFDPDRTGNVVILLDRSAWDPASGTDASNPRQQVEAITAYIDGSQVYGSDDVRARALRTLDGTGKLKTSAGDLLPFNVDGLPNFGGTDPTLFLAGDIRVNEQIGLTAMHTLWMREHNRLAELMAARHPNLSGDEIYERTRLLVGAEIQVITYKEFLPILIGPEALPPYRGYDPRENAGIANVFSVAYRVGHTLLSPMILRLDETGRSIPEGPVALRDAFFVPELIIDEGGIGPILRGLAGQTAQNVDPFIIDEVRNFLFGAPGQGGFDLPALNVQRGRDHGLPSYNRTRRDFGLPPVRLSEISSVPEIARSLREAYGDVREIDVWIGAIAEDHAPGALVGELLQTIIADQFRRLRDGDRFWYQNVFSGPQLDALESVRLSDIIRWNTEIDGEISDDVFHLTLPCPADVDANGQVDLLDLILVIQSWGESDHPADANGDGTVGVLDLLMVLTALGPCDD